MTSPPPPRTLLPKAGRRSFLLSLTSLGAGLVLPGHRLKAENRTESSYRFRTPDCEVRMNVQFLANASTEGFHFRDRLGKPALFLFSHGGEGPGRPGGFV